MASQPREGIVPRQSEVTLSGAVEGHEVDVVAGHKGHPEAVRKTGDLADVAGRKGHRAGGRWRREAADLRDDPAGRRDRPPDAGGCPAGDVTIDPLIKHAIAPGTVVSSDEYESSARHPEWGSTHRTVCHAAGELARDEDGDGSCEVQVKPSPSSLDLNKSTKVSPSWERESGGDWLLVGNTCRSAYRGRPRPVAPPGPVSHRWVFDFDGIDDATCLTDEAASLSSLGPRSGPIGGKPGPHCGPNVEPRCRRISSGPPLASVVLALGPVPASRSHALAQ